MAEDQMTAEQIAEMQKKNCIFCKIISGEVDSKKVFENDYFLGILDIRPATIGHVLLLPKEHVPILPLLAEERMIEFLQTATEIGHAVREAMISYKVTIVAASGYAAGQQAPHAMLHIIPRDKGDGLDMLDIDELKVDQPDAVALSSLFAQATTQALMHRKRQDLLGTPIAATKPAPKTEAEEIKAVEEEDFFEGKEAQAVEEEDFLEEKTQEFTSPSQALEAAIAMNPDLRKLIIAQPDLVIDYVKQSPKLAALFEGVNIRALSLLLQRQERSQPVAKIAAHMNESELFAFIDGNEGLRTWVLEHPEELVEQIGQNPRLQQFFAGINIAELAMKYRAYRQTKGGV